MRTTYVLTNKTCRRFAVQPFVLEIDAQKLLSSLFNLEDIREREWDIVSSHHWIVAWHAATFNWTPSAIA